MRAFVASQPHPWVRLQIGDHCQLLAVLALQPQEADGLDPEDAEAYNFARTVLQGTPYQNVLAYIGKGTFGRVVAAR